MSELPGTCIIVLTKAGDPLQAEWLDKHLKQDFDVAVILVDAESNEANEICNLVEINKEKL